MRGSPCSIKSTPESHLSLLKAAFERGETYPDYPSYEDRLFTPQQLWERDADGRLKIPEGPWNLTRESDIILPLQDEQESLVAQGLSLDSLGRPIHPWINSMLGDTAVGVLFGKGTYWKWGPRQTADSIVQLNDHILFVERDDTGATALPGGFINPGEAPLQAAIRETFEETDLVLPALARRIYDGPVADLRMTANSWPVTTAYHFNLGYADTLPRVKGKDDALHAKWLPAEEAMNTILFGSHQILLRMALGKEL